MKPLLTRDEARAMDAHAVRELGMVSLVLMENAGSGAAERILRFHPDALDRVVLVGGRGQNGGDAWVVARHLELAGVRTESVLVCGSDEEPIGDAAVNHATLRSLGASIVRYDGSSDESLARLDEATLIVDGLFGTGLARPVDARNAKVVERINASRAVVVALDLPSGIDADTGEALGVAVRASRTVTFGHAKRGLYQGEGARCAGSIDVVGIGAPLAAPSLASLVARDDLRSLVEPRARDAHKGTAGHVLVVAGREGTLGASLLAARGASRAGAGLVTIAASPETRTRLDLRVLESMTAAFASPDELLALSEGRRAVVLGPGLGRDADARELVARAIADCPVPLVLDADALTHLATLGLDAIAKSVSAVLTPHPGEAARLLGVTSAAIQKDRHAAAKELAARGGACVVLKGAGSIIAAPDGAQRVCVHGTPAMATGGSGDVLAGMVAAMVRRDARFDDVTAAVVLHAAAGERAAVGDRGLLASEIADSVPHVLADLTPR